MQQTGNQDSPQNLATHLTTDKTKTKGGFLARLMFEPEPPWGRSMGFAHIGCVIAAGSALSVVGLIAGLLIDIASGATTEFFSFIDSGTELSVETLFTLLPATIILSAIFQQAGQGVMPLLISRWWSGYGVVQDWGLRFKPIDILFGAGLGVLSMGVASLTSKGVGRLVGLNDLTEADNAFLLTSFGGSFWLYLMIFVVVIGAPISEEIAFRGVLQRSLARFGGPLTGIFGSAIIFTLVHFIFASFAAQVVTWASIFPVGVILATAAAYFKRLGPSIIAHLINNLVATIIALN